MRVVASTGTLLRLAAELGKARKVGDPQGIQEAQKRHDDYLEVCRRADEMSTGMTRGDLDARPAAEA